MIIRQETENDYEVTERLIEEAFKDLEFSDKNEHLLVQRLRKCDAFIPELSIVAEDNYQILGHILFTKMTIQGSKKFESLILAPVAVLPEFQKRGIGGKLIQEGLLKAKELGFESVILFGHPTYYPKFGFERASKWGIQSPMAVPDDVFMAIELKKDALNGKSGVVQFSEPFGFR
jgi:predicted N-acetyltransferase YhbS